LDITWETLRDSTEQPFFNRALQGRYQPGGVLQTPLITAALMAQLPLTEPREGASEPIEINDITINCAGRPPSDRLTLAEAYAFACPAPFYELYETLGLNTINEVFNLFKFRESFTLTGFPADDISPVQTADSQITSD